MLSADRNLKILISCVIRPDRLPAVKEALFRAGVTGITITAEAASGSSLRFIGRGGQLLKAVNGSSGSYQVRGDEGYVRVEADGENGTKGWSQPFFVSRR